MIMKTALVAAISAAMVGALAPGAHSQQPPAAPNTAPAPAPASSAQIKHELIAQLLDAMHMQKNSAAMMKSIFAQFEQYFSTVMTDAVADDENLTPSERKEANDLAKQAGLHAMKRFEELYTKQVDTAKTVSEVTESVYGKYFTESELRDMIAFYRTPTGSKMADLMPQVTAEGMRQSQAKLAPVIQKIIQQIQTEETASLNQKTALLKKKTAKH